MSNAIHSSAMRRPARRFTAFQPGFGGLLVLFACLLQPVCASAQDFARYHGDQIPTEVETMYLKGLDYLVKTQTAGGVWDGQQGNESAVIGLCVLAMLAHGDDPNSGPYAAAIRKGLDVIIKRQNASTGYIGSSMYNHGFATLALAEAYGVVSDDRIGQALKKAADLIVSSQLRNKNGAWRYSPESTDADTTLSGAQMVALFAARNAGIAVPDKAITTGLKYYTLMQSADGGFGYSGAGESSPPRSAVGALVFALARQKNGREFQSAMRYLAQGGVVDNSYPHYYIYYAAQSFFHSDIEGWKAWNKENADRLVSSQAADGSWSGECGPAFCTATSLLSLAINYRFLPIYER